MEVITLTDAKRRLSELLRRVERGETMVIVRRGKQIARFEPPGPSSSGDDAVLARLEGLGLIRRSIQSPDPALLDLAAPTIPPESSLLAAVLSERQESP